MNYTRDCPGTFFTYTYEHITVMCTYPLTPSIHVFSVSVIKYEQSNPRKKGSIWWRGVSQ